MLDTALDALARRDAAAALHAARAAVAAEPERAEAQHALGAALQLNGQLAEAAAAYDRAIELAPHSAAYHVARAALALGQRDLGTARDAIGKAVEQDPNTLAAYVMGAHLALSRGELEPAEQQLALARRVDAEHPLTLTAEGNLALARGQHEAAQRALHRAAERAPQEPLVLSSLALAYLASDNLAFAAQSLRRALAVQPQAANLRWLLIHTLRRLEHHDELVVELQALLEQAPQHWRALLLLGDTRLQLGDVDGAVEAYRRALRIADTPAAAVGAISGVLVQRGGWAIAQQLLDELLAERPQDDLLWLHRLRLVEADRAAHDAYFERWLAALPDSALAREARAQMLEHLGELDAADAEATAALARQPALFEAGMVKLRAELRTGAAEQALQRAEPLMALAGDGERRRLVQVVRGYALDRLGRYAEAAQAWSAAATEFAVEPPPAPRPPVSEPPAADAIQPRLLWGPPGSRLGMAVALLRSVPGLHVLDDRFGNGPRPDGLWPPRADGSVASAAEWQGMLQRRGFAIGDVVDCLPFYDDCIGSALPGARLLAVLDDPRELLLNWLVFGAPHGLAPPPLAAAAWLAEALEAIAREVEAGNPRFARLGAELLDREPEQAAERLRGFYALPTVPDAAAAAPAAHGLGGIPSGFAPGHWRHYADAFAEPFARLAAVAARLGYPD